MKPQEIVEDIVQTNASVRVFKAIKDNQLLTAAVLFILWQLDLFGEVMSYGCGI